MFWCFKNNSKNYFYNPLLKQASTLNSILHTQGWILTDTTKMYGILWISCNEENNPTLSPLITNEKNIAMKATDQQRKIEEDHLPSILAKVFHLANFDLYAFSKSFRASQSPTRYF